MVVVCHGSMCKVTTSRLVASCLSREGPGESSGKAQES